MAKIVITGSSTGLGLHLATILAAQGHTIIPFDIKDGFGYDVSSSFDCSEFKQMAEKEYGSIDILINNAGVNKIEYLENFSECDWELVMNTNAKGIFLVTRALLPMLKGGTVVNIVSNAAHMPMTSSLAYNASKGAAHIMTLQLARELKPRHDITVFGIAPNKLAGTGMSDDIDQQCCKVRGWDMEYAKKYQTQSLPAGEETDPQQLAEFIAYLLQSKKHHKYLTGTIIPYGA